MNTDTAASSSSRAAVSTFFTVAAPVFILVFLFGSIATFLAPETYMSKSRLRVTLKSPAGSIAVYDPVLAKTEAETIQSEIILKKVVDTLDLNEMWGKKYAGSRLKTTDTLDLLRRSIDVRPLPATALIEIRAYSDQPSEAARLANATAAAYQGHVATSSLLEVTLVDSASPGRRPIRPNKALNTVLSIIAGIVLGVAAGAIAAGATMWISGKAKRPPAVPA